MSEQEKTPMKPPRNFFIFYCIVLFLFAAILILISFLSKEGIEQELEHKTSGFESRLEQANKKNAEFAITIAKQNEEINKLTKTADDATAKLIENEKTLAASDYLIKLINAYNTGDYVKCREIIATLDAPENKDLRNYLSEEGLAELTRIEKITKGE